MSDSGLVDGGYDYDRHMRPITGSGIFFSGATGRVGDATVDAQLKNLDAGFPPATNNDAILAALLQHNEDNFSKLTVDNRSQ